MRKYIGMFMMCGVLFLSGCSFGSTTDETLSKVLTEMNNAEEESREAETELNKLEQSEQALFNTVMDLTQEDQEELKVKVAELEESLKQRLSYIEDEEVAVKKAKESAKSLDQLVEKVDADEKDEVEQLRGTINNRYDDHSVFVEAYKKLAESQKKLYAMLLEEDSELANLEAQVDEVNKQNETVKSAIDELNEATISLNTLKDNTFSLLKGNNAK